MDLCGSISGSISGSILIGKACHSSCLTLEWNKPGKSSLGWWFNRFPSQACWFQSWLSGLPTPQLLRWFHVGCIYLSNKVASFGFIEKMDGIPKGQFWYALCRRPCLLGEQKEQMWPCSVSQHAISDGQKVEMLKAESQLRPLQSLFGEQQPLYWQNDSDNGAIVEA